MGIEYTHYVLPVPGTWRPSSAQFAGLIHRLKREAFVPEHPPELLRPHREESPIAEIEAHVAEEWLKGDMILRWYLDRTENADAPYPLEPLAMVPADPYWTIEVRSSPDYIQRVSEIIEPLASTKCACGEDLEYQHHDGRDIFYSSRIRRVCPRCRKVFDPGMRACVYHHPWTDQATQLPGGCVHSIALVVDCGKCHPHKHWSPKVTSILRRCLTEELGCEIREVGDYS